MCWIPVMMLIIAKSLLLKLNEIFTLKELVYNLKSALGRNLL